MGGGRRGAGAGPAGGRARGLPLPARPRGARGLERRSSPPRTGRSAISCASAWRRSSGRRTRRFALGPGAEVLWRGAGVARLVAGESALAPQVDVLASDLLDPPLRERVRRRLACWLDAHLRAALGPLFALRDGAPAGAARGLAFALAEGLGAVPRRTVARQVAALTPDDRRELSRLGVTIGRLAVFLPAAAAAGGRCGCGPGSSAIREGRPAEAGPDGPPSVPRDPRRPAGLLPRLRLPPRRPARRAPRPAGARGRRRLAPLPRGTVRPPARARRRSSAADRSEVPAVLTAIGYVERDGRFERRRARGSGLESRFKTSDPRAASSACMTVPRDARTGYTSDSRIDAS